MKLSLLDARNSDRSSRLSSRVVKVEGGQKSGKSDFFKGRRAEGPRGSKTKQRKTEPKNTKTQEELDKELDFYRGDDSTEPQASAAADSQE